MLLAYVQLGIYQDPQVLFCQILFQSVKPQHILVNGVVLQVQDFVLPFLEHH